MMHSIQCILCGLLGIAETCVDLAVWESCVDLLWLGSCSRGWRGGCSRILRGCTHPTQHKSKFWLCDLGGVAVVKIGEFLCDPWRSWWKLTFHRRPQAAGEMGISTQDRPGRSLPAGGLVWKHKTSVCVHQTKPHSSSNPQAERSYTFRSQIFQIKFWITMSQRHVPVNACNILEESYWNLKVIS